MPVAARCDLSLCLRGCISLLKWPGPRLRSSCHPGTAHTFFVGANDKPRAGELINVLREAKQEVPEELLKFGTTGAQCGVGGGG